LENCFGETFNTTLKTTQNLLSSLIKNHNIVHNTFLWCSKGEERGMRDEGGDEGRDERRDEGRRGGKEARLNH
jgi:hypothetical protein